MSEAVVELIKFIGELACILGAGYALTVCLFYLPLQYKKGKKFQCFLCISLGLFAIALYARVFS